MDQPNFSCQDEQHETQFFLDLLELFRLISSSSMFSIIFNLLIAFTVECSLCLHHPSRYIDSYIFLLHFYHLVQKVDSSQKLSPPKSESNILIPFHPKNSKQSISNPNICKNNFSSNSRSNACQGKRQRKMHQLKATQNIQGKTKHSFGFEAIQVKTQTKRQGSLFSPLMLQQPGNILQHIYQDHWT